MKEFDVIARYFRPLASTQPASLNLSDDAALLDIPEGQQLVVTKDALVAGTHFFGDEEPALIAQKVLRTNLSDLAAMGASPLTYFLAVMLPLDTDEEWVAHFARGLGEDQATYGITLGGGDTTATNSTIAFSVTAMGLVPTGAALRRNGAKAGDTVYVSGTLGDAALGLQLMLNAFTVPDEEDEKFLAGRYFLPQPRLKLGQRLRGIAHSAMDISDGLVQDLEHLCRASNVGALIDRGRLPLSNSAWKVVSLFPQRWQHITGGGDDYELLFTAPADKADAIAALASELNVKITAIGEIVAKSGVHVRDDSGQPISFTSGGYSHTWTKP